MDTLLLKAALHHHNIADFNSDEVVTRQLTVLGNTLHKITDIQFIRGKYDNHDYLKAIIDLFKSWDNAFLPHFQAIEKVLHLIYDCLIYHQENDADAEIEIAEDLSHQGLQDITNPAALCKVGKERLEQALQPLQDVNVISF